MEGDGWNEVDGGTCVFLDEDDEDAFLGVAVDVEGTAAGVLLAVWAVAAWAFLETLLPRSASL